MKQNSKTHTFSLFLILILISNLFSCKKDASDYNCLYFQGKEERDIKILQKGFENAEPYFSQLCAEELSTLLPKQKAVELARKAIKTYPESIEMKILLLDLLYDQRDYSGIISFSENNKESLINNEINRLYLSALVRSSKKGELNQEVMDKINSWYIENEFSESHNTFFMEFSLEDFFDTATIARHFAYIQYYGKAASTIETTFPTIDDFLSFISSLSYYELKEIGDAFVYGSKDKVKYSEYFARAGLLSSDKDKAFYSLFTAGRLNEKVYVSSPKNIEYYRSAIYLAPETSFDRALWYYIRGAMNCSIEDGIQGFLEFSNAWKDPYFFDDVIETFSATLLSNHQWEYYYNLFSVIYPYLSAPSRGKTDYIIGTLIEANLINFGNGSREIAMDYYKKTYSNIEAENYYRIMASIKLDEKLNLQKPEYPTKNSKPTPEEEHLSYLIKKDIDAVYDFFVENQEKISEDVAIKAVLALEEAGKKNPGLYTLALRIATAAISEEENIKHIYPQYFNEYVENVSKEFNLLEYVLYGLIRAESYFEPTAKSSAGALGLCQLMPSTAGDVARKLKISEYDLLDPKTNISFGGYYLGELTSRSDGNVFLALLSYNAGRENVKKWINLDSSLPMDVFLETVPFEETRKYGRKLINLSVLYGTLYYKLSPKEVVSNMGVLH